MMHDRFAPRLRGRLALEQAQEAEAVFAGAGWQLLVDYLGQRGHDIGQTYQLVARAAGLDNVWPANDKRHAMPAFPDVGLLPAPIGVRAMAPLFDVAGQPMGSVVAGED